VITVDAGVKARDSRIGGIRPRRRCDRQPIESKKNVLSRGLTQRTLCPMDLAKWSDPPADRFEKAAGLVAAPPGG